LPEHTLERDAETKERRKRIERREKKARRREADGGGVAEKFLERRKEPGKMNSLSLRQPRRRKRKRRSEEERKTQRACRTPGNRIARDYDYPWRRKGVIYPVAILITAPGHIIQPGVPHPETAPGDRLRYVHTDVGASYGGVN